MNSFHRNDTCPSMCPIWVALSIRRRAQLNLPNPNCPIVVFTHNDNISYITSGLVSFFIKKSARLFFGDDLPDSLLKKITPYLSWVGSCIFMDEQDMSSLFIQKRLRWRSDTFMDYLRNTFAIAKKNTANWLNPTTSYLFGITHMFLF